MQQDEKEYLELSQNLKISPRFAKYLIKHCDSRYDRVRAATKMYQGMHKQIDQLSKIFSKYEIDGLIVYKDQDNDSFTRFWRDLGIEDNTTLQLYITYKFGAQRGAQFSLEEFLLGMIRLKCNTIRELAQKMPELRNKIEKENKYRKLYSYYFKVISLGANTIKFNDAITLWDNLLKDTFPQIKQFIAFCTKGKSAEFQSQTRVSFDLWCQVWKFFEVIGNDYTKFDENDAWPLLIYEFVKFQTKQ